MHEMLKLYVRGGFEFVDEDTGFTTSDFGVSDNSLNERVTSLDVPAYRPEIEFVEECIENGVYDSAAKLAHAVAEVPHVEKIDYVGDLSIGYYGVYVTATAPYGQSTKSITEIGISLEIIVEVKDRNGADTRDIAYKVVKIFKNDLSRRLNTYMDNITIETRYI